jgi:hypothetical protein
VGHQTDSNPPHQAALSSSLANSPLPPGWTRVETTSGRISWRCEIGILSFDHPGYSEYIAFGCEEHASCMWIRIHPVNFPTQGMFERGWVCVWDDVLEDSIPEDYTTISLCVSNLACQMTPKSWVKRPRPVTTPEKDIANTTAEPLRRWFQIYTLEGRVVFAKSPKGDGITYVDPRWSISKRNGDEFHMARKRRNTL